MRTKPVVFISSTSDLADERQAVARALPPVYDPYLYEQERAGGASPEKRLLQALADADVFVSVLGPAFGTVHPADPDQRSIVEWEFDTARQRPELEIMPFIKSGAQAAATNPQQLAFLARVAAFDDGAWCKTFSATADLSLMVVQSLSQWREELMRRLAAGSGRVRALTKRLLIPISVVSALMSVVAGLGHLISVQTELLVCGMSFLVIVICILVLFFLDGGSDGTVS